MENVCDIVPAGPEFRQFQALIFNIAGISLPVAEQQSVSNRLAARVRHYGLKSCDDYYRLIMMPESIEELQTAVDLLVANETGFFREPAQFELLRGLMLPLSSGRQGIRIWSGACSSGEEAYSAAMMLADVLGEKAWEVIASDISVRMLEQARSGRYPAKQANGIPAEYLSKYCRRDAGTVVVDRRVRERVRFLQINLNADLPALGQFDVVFLRNVLDCFDDDTRRSVMQRVLPRLRPGGFFLIGGSETLNGVDGALEMVAPSVFRKH